MPTKKFRDLAKPLRDDPRHRADIERHRKEALVEMVEYGLAELRRGLDVTQTEIAETLGVTQPAVSHLENTDELQLSTLRRYVEALGGTLEIAVLLHGERIPLELAS